jgi:hypothetical protein
MAGASLPVYSRSQPLTVLWVLMLPVLAMLALLYALNRDGAAGAALAFGALLTLAPMPFLGRLTVEVSAEALSWRFGWLGWPRWSVALQDIERVEIAKTSGLEGVGIQRTREGWLYNARSGPALRVLLRNGRSLRIGSDEPARLAAFIEARLPGAQRQG